ERPAFIAEMTHPPSRKEGHASRSVAGHETLLVVVGVSDALRVRAKLVEKRNQLSNLEAVNRGLSEPLQRTDRVSGQHHLIRPSDGEERVDVSDDHEIEVQKQDRPFQRAETRPPKPRLLPD